MYHTLVLISCIRLDKRGKWGKNGHPARAPRKSQWAPQNIADINSYRPEALEKCIDGSLNSKKPWRTVRIGANLSPKGGPGTQNMYAQSAL